MIQSQMWGSDSCGCVFEEEYDDDNPEIKTLKRVIFVCDSHNPQKNVKIKTVQDSHNVAHKENTEKESLRQSIIDSNALPLSAVDTITSYDEETRTLQNTNVLYKNIMFKYYYNKDDQLVFSLEGVDKNGNVLTLDNNQKSSLSTVLSSKMGSGKCLQKDLITVNTDNEYKKALENRSKGTAEFMQEHDRLEQERQTKLTAKESLVKFFGNKL